MALSNLKISEQELKDHLHVNQPNTPTMTATELKEFFDWIFWLIKGRFDSLVNEFTTNGDIANEITIQDPNDPNKTISLSAFFQRIKDIINNFQNSIIDDNNGIFQIKGYIGINPPANGLRERDMWVNYDGIPSTIPFENVKEWSETEWVDIDDYYPNFFDIWIDLANNRGLFWLNNGWNEIDTNLNLASIIDLIYSRTTFIDCGLFTDPLDTESVGLVGGNHDFGNL